MHANRTAAGGLHAAATAERSARVTAARLTAADRSGAGRSGAVAGTAGRECEPGTSAAEVCGTGEVLGAVHKNSAAGAIDPRRSARTRGRCTRTAAGAC